MKGINLNKINKDNWKIQLIWNDINTLKEGSLVLGVNFNEKLAMPSSE